MTQEDFRQGCIFWESKKRSGQFITGEKQHFERHESANFDTFYFFPPKMLILTILSQKSAILDNFQLLIYIFSPESSGLYIY